LLRPRDGKSKPIIARKPSASSRVHSHRVHSHRVPSRTRGCLDSGPSDRTL
jgi:hypothetical protein